MDRTRNRGWSTARRTVRRAAVLVGIVTAGVIGVSTPALAASNQAGGMNYFACEAKRMNYAAAGYTVTDCIYFTSTGSWQFFYSDMRVE